MHLLFFESTYSLRRTVLIFSFYSFGEGWVVGLSPLVRSRVSVSRGYNPCFGRVEAPNAQLAHCLSFGQDLDGDLLSDLSLNPYPWASLSSRRTQDMHGERAHTRTFICMCAIHAIVTTCITSKAIDSNLHHVLGLFCLIIFLTIDSSLNILGILVYLSIPLVFQIVYVNALAVSFYRLLFIGTNKALVKS